MIARLLTIVALLLVLAWQSWQLYLDYREPAVAGMVAAPGPAASIEVPADPFLLRRDVRTDQLLARSPFWPSRRPIFPPPPDVPEATAPAATPAVVVDNDPPPFRVTGIVITDEVQLAFLVGIRPAKTEEQAVRVGESFEGWVLEKVASDGVTVGRNGRHEKLLHRDFSGDRALASQPVGSKKR